jgi:uncharacterized FlgJ-related protein
MPDGSELAAGLTGYSERGLEYVEEIRTMLRVNGDMIAQVGERGDETGFEEG